MKFYATLGPKCSEAALLGKMVKVGMTGLRYNAAHGTAEEAYDVFRAYRAAAKARGTDSTLLLDLVGAKLRIGPLPEPQWLADGAVCHLVDSHAARGTEGEIPLPREVLEVLEAGDHLYLDDRKLLLEVGQRTGEVWAARVVHGGWLHTGKTVKIADRSVTLPPLAASDQATLAFFAPLGVDEVMVPFCETASDLEIVRRAMAAHGCGSARLLAKIETPRGVDNIDELIEVCDEVVIARGDLGNAYSIPEVPRLQKHLAMRCRAKGRDFLVVTELLASMVHAWTPTRAEVSDIYQAVWEGASSLMLTGETAVGDHPVEAMSVLVETARLAAQDRQAYDREGFFF